MLIFSGDSLLVDKVASTDVADVVISDLGDAPVNDEESGGLTKLFDGDAIPDAVDERVEEDTEVVDAPVNGDAS